LKNVSPIMSLQTFLQRPSEVVSSPNEYVRIGSPPECKQPQLYASLSEKGNPELKTLLAVLNSLGLRLSVAHTTPTRHGEPALRLLQGP